MISPVSKKWREDFKAGGVKRDMALARFSLGTMAYLTIQQMYEAGIVTGSGPTDPASRKSLQGLGWQQNSVRVGDTYYGFNNLDPMGFSMSMIASGMDRTKYAQSEDEATVLMLDSVMSMGESFRAKTFMTGFAEIFKLLGGGSEGTLKAGTRFASGIAASFVPAWLTVGAKAVDSSEEGGTIRRDQSRFSKSFEGIWMNFSKTIDSRTPWGRTHLPAQRNWRGEVVAASGGGWADELFFLKRSDAKTDAGTAALLENWVAPAVPAQQQSFILPPEMAAQYGQAEVQIDLLALDANGGDVFEQFQVYVGRARNLMVSDFAKSQKYHEMPEDQKGNNSIAASIFSSLLERGLQAGKAQFFADYNKLAESRGWAALDGNEIIQLLDNKIGEKNKPFPMPESTAPNQMPEF